MKISYINGVCVKNDAISNSIIDEISWLNNTHNSDILLFTYACEFEQLNYKIITTLKDIAVDAHFKSSDLIIFHFGIYCPLFNLLPVTPNNAKRMVVFHNITPKKFTHSEQHALIDKSFKQLSNITLADHVICDSQTNLDILREASIQTPASILPLAVHNTKPAPDTKPSFVDKVIRIAFIGRFVLSKGPNDLLEAFSRLLQHQILPTIEITMIGNLSFSDTILVSEIRDTINKLHSYHNHCIKIHINANASDDDKNKTLQNADLFILPTYHEGFCIPILEALANGCKVITYDNSNTPSVSGGLAKLVPTGNIEALKSTISEELQLVLSERWSNSGSGSYTEYKNKAQQYTEQYSPTLTKQRFLQTIKTLTI